MRSDFRTLVAAAAMALMVAPEFALAQQPNAAPATPPARIGNRTDYKELQSTTSEICGSGGKVSVDCSQKDAKELDNIRRSLDTPAPAYPASGRAVMPPDGTR